MPVVQEFTEFVEVQVMMSQPKRGFAESASRRDVVVVEESAMLVNLEMMKEEDMAPLVKTELQDSAATITINPEISSEVSVDIKVLSPELTALCWMEPTEEVVTLLKNLKQKMLAFWLAQPMALDLPTVLLKKPILLPEALLKHIPEVLQPLGLIVLTTLTQAGTLVRGHSLEYLVLEVLVPHLTVLQDLRK
jgi:hypothetical protein